MGRKESNQTKEQQFNMHAWIQKVLPEGVQLWYLFWGERGFKNDLKLWNVQYACADPESLVRGVSNSNNFFAVQL